MGDGDKGFKQSLKKKYVDFMQNSSVIFLRHNQKREAITHPF
jgi:hypothetical protein